MDDLISRQAVDTLVDELARAISDERCCISRGRSTATIMQDILDLPSVIPQEPKTGHWIVHPEIETSTPEYLMFYECSECGDKQCFCKSDIHKKHFCNNCGARMVEPKLSEIPTDSKDVIWYSKRNYSEIVIEPQERSE